MRDVLFMEFTKVSSSLDNTCHTIIPNVHKQDHPIMQGKIHHLRPQEEEEKAVYNQESLSGDGTIYTVKI